MLLKIGADPEFFLRKNGEFVSAHDLVPGTKKKPHILSVGAVQVDGTAVEFNIKPATTAKEFEEHIRTTLLEIRDMIPKEYEFVFTPAVEYPKHYFDSIPIKFKRLGCDPDFNAYSAGKVNPKPNGETTLRTGAGHLHLGWGSNLQLTPDHIWDCCAIVQKMDSYIANVAPAWDDDRKRRVLYGAPGAFRPKPYGVEYRVLSNKWVAYPNLWSWLFERTRDVFYTLLENSYMRPKNLPNSYGDLQWLNSSRL